MDIKEIVEQSEQLLMNNQNKWTALWNGYADTIKNKSKKILGFRKTYREWKPLRIYMSVNDILQNDNELSLRFMGSEVAKLFIDENAKPYLKISPEKAQFNHKKFSLDIKANDYDWQSKEATEFRNYFKSLKVAYHHECTLESLILDEMEKGSGDKFLGTMRNFRPIELLDTFRFQMPVPLSAHDGKPKYTKGNIDILARIGSGGNTNVSILELKKNKRSSNTYKYALTQSIIYSICIRYILRDSKIGDKWWEIFGYKKKMPQKLTLLSVAMIPHQLKDFYEKEVQELNLKNIDSCINMEEDHIKCGHIFFDQKNDDKNNNRIEIVGKSNF